jgi:hypothetical protein
LTAVFRPRHTPSDARQPPFRTLVVAGFLPGAGRWRCRLSTP